MSKEVKYIVIHCSATKPSMDIGRKEIDVWHKARGWTGIGYHFVIRRSGTVEIGRPLNEDHVIDTNEIGAHVAGLNSVSVGVCMVGGVTQLSVDIPESNFTPEQWTQLNLLIGNLERQFPNAQVVGHRELDKGKACPSFDVQEWKKTRGG